MSDYCDNDLLIRGDKKSMKEFYDFIGSDLEENFLMENIMPIPKEIEDSGLTKIFHHFKTNTITLDSGETIEVKVDNYNHTEAEFKEKSEYLIKKYGYCDWCDWCENNWGCTSDMEIESFGSSKTEMSVSYTTHWQPNIEFIRFLSIKFPKLNFELKYCEPLNELAGIFTIKHSEEELIELPVTTIYFARNDDDSGYKFVKSENDAYDFDDYEELDIVGYDWQKAILEYGFCEEDIKNWKKLKRFFEEKFKN